MLLFGGAIAVIGLGSQTFITDSAHPLANWNRKGVNHLQIGKRLFGLADYLLLNQGFELPEVRRLADKKRAVGKIRKPMLIMRFEIIEKVFIGWMFEVFTADAP